MEAATIIVRKARGGLVVQATGRTGKGQRFIKGSEVLKVKSIADKNFKAEMAAAVEKLLNSDA